MQFRKWRYFRRSPVIVKSYPGTGTGSSPCHRDLISSYEASPPSLSLLLVLLPPWQQQPRRMSKMSSRSSSASPLVLLLRYFRGGQRIRNVCQTGAPLHSTRGHEERYGNERPHGKEEEDDGESTVNTQ